MEEVVGSIPTRSTKSLVSAPRLAGEVVGSIPTRSTKFLNRLVGRVRVDMASVSWFVPNPPF